MMPTEISPTLGRRRVLQGAAAVGTASILSPARAAPPGARANFTLASPNEPAVRPGSAFELAVDRQLINKTGTRSWANAINGGVPGPTLRWREGDVVTINLANRMPEMTGFHWHGIILPNPMDGVPGLQFPGIQPGETFTYRFPVLQSGTYWYHSHMGYQEQKGAYGALIIDPAGEPLVKADRDYAVVLSDWTDQDPHVIANNFKHDSEMYNFGRRTLRTFFSDAAHSRLGAAVSERWRWADMRMDPSGIQAPTGYTYTYLVNGFPPEANWTALFRPGERVRLRFINASAASFFDVSLPGLTMEVVHAHGNDVVPVPVDQFRIGIAETFDVMVQPREDRAYTIFVQSMDRSGYARGTLAPRDGMEAPIPPMDDRPLRTMTDMGMPGMAPAQVGASPVGNSSRIGGLMPSMRGGQAGLPPGRRQANEPRTEHPPQSPGTGVESLFVAKTPTRRLDLPGDGLNHLDRRVLTYADLRSVHPGVDRRPPTREVLLHITGNMRRFIWGLDGKKFSEVGPIDVTLGERFRLRFINDTMMNHPFHLHGMWMVLENGQGDHCPYLHTVNVKPAEDISLLVTPVATGQWPLHCHVLYHFEAGMFRTVRVLPRNA